MCDVISLIKEVSVSERLWRANKDVGETFSLTYVHVSGAVYSVH